MPPGRSTLDAWRLIGSKVAKCGSWWSWRRRRKFMDPREREGGCFPHWSSADHAWRTVRQRRFVSYFMSPCHKLDRNSLAISPEAESSRFDRPFVLVMLGIPTPLSKSNVLITRDREKTHWRGTSKRFWPATIYDEIRIANGVRGWTCPRFGETTVSEMNRSWTPRPGVGSIVSWWIEFIQANGIALQKFD